MVEFLPSVLTYIDSEDNRIRANAIEAAGRLGYEGKELSKYLEDSNNRVRATSPALWVTGEGPPDFAPSQHIHSAEGHESYLDPLTTFNNLYSEHTKSSNSTRSYTMEVVDVIGELVIAKVVGTQNPKKSFKYIVSRISGGDN